MTDKWCDNTIFMGNGLGMAIAPEHFSLKEAMNAFWSSNQNNEFSKFCKKFSESNSSLPTTEDQLRDIHIFFDSLYRIKKINNVDINGNINNKLFGMMDSYHVFIMSIVKHFYDFNLENHINKHKFIDFSNEIKEIIINNSAKGHRINISTINYDKLIYASFLDEKNEDRKVLTGVFKTSKLIDGFFKKNKNGHPTFDIRNFENYSKSKQGFYLQLHGSPLFYGDEDGKIAKLKRNDITKSTLEDIEKDISDNISIEHLVLCNQNIKQRHIVSSPLLYGMFEAFKYRIRNSKKIIIFGYGGMDDHINNVFAKANDSELYVIENKEHGNKFSFWNNKFPGLKEANYSHYTNILEADSINRLKEILSP